jgi:hypothetical protein
VRAAMVAEIPPVKTAFFAPSGRCQVPTLLASFAGRMMHQMVPSDSGALRTKFQGADRSWPAAAQVFRPVSARSGRRVTLSSVGASSYPARPDGEAP